jgi:predicted PurR-regulated permease PerM
MTEDVRRARWIAVLAATALVLYICWLMLKPFLAVLGWASVFVIVFYPVHRRIVARVRRPGLSALISSLLVILIVVLPLAFLVTALARELAGATTMLPPILDTQSTRATQVLTWIQERLSIGTIDLQTLLSQKLQQVGQAVLNQSVGMLGNLVSAIVQTGFVIFTMYYLFRDGEKIIAALPDALPLQRHQSEAILSRTAQVISASVYGVVFIAGIQGILGGLAFWVLGIPSPMLWGVLLGIVCMIPIAGSFLIWLPAAIYLGLTGHWTKALLLVLWGALVISSIDNLLRPRFMRQYTKLHELFVFFSVLGGITVFGLLGIVLGPVVLAVTMGLLNTFRVETDAQKPEPIG